MYGERLIPKLAYGIHPTTSKQPPQELVVGSLSPRPRGQRSATRPGRTAEREILEGVQRTKENPYMQEVRLLGSRPRCEGFRADPCKPLFNVRRPYLRSGGGCGPADRSRAQGHETLSGPRRTGSTVRRQRSETKKVKKNA